MPRLGPFALPSDHTDWLPALIFSMAASVAALCSAAYAIVGTIGALSSRL
jgi:hypothetical protein